MSKSRKLNIKSSTEPLFDYYSPLDLRIVRAATFCYCSLIGGTAVQFLARRYGVKERRARSINDLDFITPVNNPCLGQFNEWLVKNNFKEIKAGVSEYLWNYENPVLGVEVDLLISHERGLANQMFVEGPFLLWHPVYLFVSKVQRMTILNAKADTDKADLNTLYDILKKRKELPLLEEALAKLDLSDAGIKMVNDVILE